MMLLRIGIVPLVFSAQAALAALPPQFQNKKDLDVMVQFIKSHDSVMATLESIDFDEYTVYYRRGCKVTFGRKRTPKPAGWVGPADPLEFKHSSCTLD